MVVYVATLYEQCQAARVLEPIRWLLTRYPRATKFFVVNAVLMPGVNLGVLWLFVLLGFDPIQANIARSFLTSEVQFVVHRFWTFKDCRNLSIWQHWWRFHAARAVGMMLNQGLFVIALLYLPFGYVADYLICSSVVGVISYPLQKKFVFKLKAV